MNFKEKSKAYRELNARQNAEYDLKLLSKLIPQSKLLVKFSRNPEFYAGDILYTLLDYTTREDVVSNRRSLSKSGSSEDNTDTSDNETNPDTDNQSEDNADTSDNETNPDTDNQSEDNTDTSDNETNPDTDNQSEDENSVIEEKKSKVLS
jgi:hypothetical protein